MWSVHARDGRRPPSSPHRAGEAKIGGKEVVDQHRSPGIKAVSMLSQGTRGSTRGIARKNMIFQGQVAGAMALVVSYTFRVLC